jgi:hypothetical protein
VATLNRRLAAPVFAQVVSFAVVLAIGAAVGGSSSPVHRVKLTIAAVPATTSARSTGILGGNRSASPAPTSPAPTSPAPSSAAPSSAGISGQFGGLRVWVLRVGAPVIVASGRLNPAANQVPSVPKGFSFLCVSPPSAGRLVGPAALGPAAWICSAVRAGNDSAAAASGMLNSAGKFVTSVPEGSYLVCVSAPAGWRSVNAAVVLPGWICERAKVGGDLYALEFPLTRQAPTRSRSGQ